MAFSGELRVGAYRIPRMRYDQIEPGDIVVTYEALTTRQDLLAFRTLMRRAQLFDRPELNKMFHAEVIVHAYPRPGMCQIAHAEGATRQVLIQEEDFQAHHPGQALLFFRAKDPKIRKEIANVATQTATPFNGHQCKTLSLESSWEMMKLSARFFLFENSGESASTKTLRNIAQMAVNFEENKRFYGDQGSGIKEMRCVEYVANVINVASIRILFPSSALAVTRDQKMNAIFTHLQEINSSRVLPLKLSCIDATTPKLVEFFLSDQQCFQTVGYLGAICDRIEGPLLDIRGESVLIPPSDISRILSCKSLKDVSPDPLYAMNVIQVLQMGQASLIYLKAFLDPVKNRVLYIALVARALQLPLTEAMSLVEQERDGISWPEFYRQVREEILKWRGRQAINDRCDEPWVDSWSCTMAREILFIEKECIKRASIERTDRTLQLSLNVLALREIQAKKIHSIAQRIFDTGQIALKTIALSPLTVGFRAAAYVLHWIGDQKERVCSQLMKDILTVHEKVRKNGRLTLQSIPLPKGCRPWIQYSTDGRTSWDVEPFIWETTAWNAYLPVSTQEDCVYRAFVGPENLHDPDPIGKALAWEKRGIDTACIVSRTSMKSLLVDEKQYLQIGTIENPVWLDTLLPPSKNVQVAEFRQKCNQIALERSGGTSIGEFEEGFARLETTLPRAAITQLVSEDPIADHVANFLGNQLNVRVLPGQIQFMKGGLGKGLSGDRIYKILDSMNRPRIVVKAFMRLRGKFMREFHVLESHNQLALRTLSIPRVLAIGSGTLDDRVLYFLAMDYIPGTSLYSTFRALSSCRLSTQERQVAFESLRGSYAKLGNGMREFHSSTKSLALPLHPVFANLLELFSKNALRLLKQNFDPALWFQCNTFLNDGLQRERQKKFFRSYFHGDINTGNLIDNPITGQLSVIDWPDGSLSVGKDGEPMGVSFYDLIQIRNELLTKKIEGISDVEIETLYQDFLKEYMKEGLSLPSEETWRFFSAIDLMGSVSWFVKKKEMFEPNQRPIAESVYQLKLQQLKEVIQPA
jgi:hypothetical protein